MHGAVNRRFLETTRGQVVVLLRAGPRTVDELAEALGLTDNAVRVHLTTLERDGVVRSTGVRRGEKAGKPATLYELTHEADAQFSRAYVPVLRAVLDQLASELPAARIREVLAGVGRRLASGAMPAPSASHDQRLQSALDLLTGLGGSVTLEQRPGARVIRGRGCPLAAVVSQRPEACHLMEVLLGEILGAPVRECCQHGERPSCCFEVASAA